MLMVTLWCRSRSRIAVASQTCASLPSAVEDTRSGAGWKSSYNRKMRTLSNPAARITAKSRALRAGSKRRHHAMAVSGGQ